MCPDNNVHESYWNPAVEPERPFATPNWIQQSPEADRCPPWINLDVDSKLRLLNWKSSLRDHHNRKAHWNPNQEYSDPGLQLRAKQNPTIIIINFPGQHYSQNLINLQVIFSLVMHFQLINAKCPRGNCLLEIPATNALLVFDCKSAKLRKNVANLSNSNNSSETT